MWHVKLYLNITCHIHSISVNVRIDGSHTIAVREITHLHMHLHRCLNGVPRVVMAVIEVARS